MNQLAIDFTLAVAARDRGMTQAAEHAERAHDCWGETAMAFLERFAETHATFISEDVSDATRADGTFPQPPTDRAWGAIYVRAARLGLIEKVGIGRSRRRHASICPKWRSLIVKDAA